MVGADVGLFDEGLEDALLNGQPRNLVTELTYQVFGHIEQEAEVFLVAVPTPALEHGALHILSRTGFPSWQIVCAAEWMNSGSGSRRVGPSPGLVERVPEDPNGLCA